jgi:hypothetical protein
LKIADTEGRDQLLAIEEALTYRRIGEARSRHFA